LDPGGGGAQFTPTVSPHESTNAVLVACDMTGTYISKDGGVSWRMFQICAEDPASWSSDPVDPDVIYVKTIGLVGASTDRETPGQLVLPDPSTLIAIDMPDDHASERLVTNGPPRLNPSPRWRSIPPTPRRCTPP